MTERAGPSTVHFALTPAPEFLPTLKVAVSRLAEQAGVEETHRFNLQQAVAQACRRALEKEAQEAGAELRMTVSRLSDRLEIVVEGGKDASKTTEADLFLLNQLLDRVILEETAEGKRRLTLVKYFTRVGSQP